MTRRAASPELLDDEEDQLAAYMALITRGMVRRVAIYHNVLLPKGTRLRGIQIIRDVWLARDMQFYKLFPGDHRARQLTFREAVEWVRVAKIREKINRAFDASRAINDVPPERPVR